MGISSYTDEAIQAQGQAILARKQREHLTSKHRGVNRHKGQKGWVAWASSFTFNKKKIGLGYFETEAEVREVPPPQKDSCIATFALNAREGGRSMSKRPHITWMTSVIYLSSGFHVVNFRLCENVTWL